jgi:hypothetical protein
MKAETQETLQGFVALGVLIVIMLIGGFVQWL